VPVEGRQLVDDPVEGKCTTKGPRIVDVNARLGGGGIHQMIEAVWGRPAPGLSSTSRLKWGKR
jgi:hypothetical protein